jgi:hypothetical protein
MTTIITQRPTSPQLSNSRINNIIMFMAAIGIAAMIIATQPFNPGAAPAQIDRSPSRSAIVANPTVPKADWCCLGSRPAEGLGKGMTDVGEVTSSVDNNPRMNPLAVRSVGLDPGAIDKLIGGTLHADVRPAHSSNNHVR